jgi:hypothetical protein
MCVQAKGKCACARLEGRTPVNDYVKVLRSAWKGGRGRLFPHGRAGRGAPGDWTGRAAPALLLAVLRLCGCAAVRLCGSPCCYGR